MPSVGGGAGFTEATSNDGVNRPCLTEERRRRKQRQHGAHVHLHLANPHTTDNDEVCHFVTVEPSVLGWDLFGVVDDQDLDRRFACLEFQSKLLLHGGEERRPYRALGEGAGVRPG